MAPKESTPKLEVDVDNLDDLKYVLKRYYVGGQLRGVIVENRDDYAVLKGIIRDLCEQAIEEATSTYKTELDESHKKITALDKECRDAYATMKTLNSDIIQYKEELNYSHTRIDELLNLIDYFKEFQPEILKTALEWIELQHNIKNRKKSPKKSTTKPNNTKETNRILQYIKNLDQVNGTNQHDKYEEAIKNYGYKDIEVYDVWGNM